MSLYIDVYFVVKPYFVLRYITVNLIISKANFLFGATVGSVEDRPIRTLEETGFIARTSSPTSCSPSTELKLKWMRLSYIQSIGQ